MNLSHDHICEEKKIPFLINVGHLVSDTREWEGGDRALSPIFQRGIVILVLGNFNKIISVHFSFPQFQHARHAPMYQIGFCFLSIEFVGQSVSSSSCQGGSHLIPLLHNSPPKSDVIFLYMKICFISFNGCFLNSCCFIKKCWFLNFI